MKTRTLRLSPWRAVALVALSMALSWPAAAEDERAIGCFADARDRDLPSVTQLGARNSVGRCIAHCSEQGYAFAGLQYGTYCACGNSYGKHGRSDRCNVSCPGDPRQTCGGEYANSVYATREGYEGGRHLGCYGDSERERDLPDLTKLGQRNTPRACIDHCASRGYPYAGLQHGTFCACGKRYGRHGRSERCDVPCPGNPKRTCGGSFANSIYTTGVGGGDGGSVGEWSRDTTLRGSDLHAFGMRRPSPELCRQACEADRRCEGWTFARSGSLGRSYPQCFLKERVTSSQRDACCISGTLP